MPNTFFTSDTHFFHESIIEYSNRPFVDVDHMNEGLIHNWNTVVGEEDTVFHLGDVSFGNRTMTEAVLNRLNGHLFMVKGNHDRKVYSRFEWVKDYYEHQFPNPLKPGELVPFVLFHFPIAQWHRKHYGAIHIHGHCHGSFPVNLSEKRFDVGTDVWKYAPISLLDIIRHSANFGIPGTDHHGNEVSTLA